eukprot:9504129-Pyramimonas_sp.AAC.1
MQAQLRKKQGGEWRQEQANQPQKWLLPRTGGNCRCEQLMCIRLNWDAAQSHSAKSPLNKRHEARKGKDKVVQIIRRGVH